MNVNLTGVISSAYHSGNQKKTSDYQPSATASDFAELMKKLAGTEMLWKEQPQEAFATDSEKDYTEMMGKLMPVRDEEN